MRIASPTFPVLTAALLAGAATAGAQATTATPSPDRVIIERTPRAVSIYRSDMNDNRAMLGIGTSSGGPRDTLGLLVTSVAANGPAEKAGIVEGNRIASINGVNLRLSAADAGQEDMDGIATRRLIRELSKVTPGTDVELRVYADGQWKTMRVKTTSRDSLYPTRFTRGTDTDDRAVLGFQLNATGSKRDTLGVFIGSLKEDGPAEKAGLVEGDRIVSVNGTDLRVPRDDIGDNEVSATMVNRFQRVMRAVKPGDKVQLRVWSGGQVKNITITAVKASEIYKSENRFRFVGPGMWELGDAPVIAPVPPVPPLPALAPRVRINSMDMLDMNDDDSDMADDAATRATVERAVEAARAAGAAKRLDDATLREIERSRTTAHRMLSKTADIATAAPALAAVWTTDAASVERAAAAASASGMIDLPGLSLAPVTPELAEYLGKGSENGYLVLESSGNWGELHAGDVIISVDGSAVRDGGVTTEGHDFIVLRKGRKVTVHI